LTPAGRALARKAPEPAQERLIAGLRRLRPTQLRSLARGLSALVQALELPGEPAGGFFEERSRRAARHAGPRRRGVWGRPGATDGSAVHHASRDIGLVEESRLDDRPVHVREERLDVAGPFRRLVVDEEGMLPHVHDEERAEARRVAVLVQRDPMIAEPPGLRILVENGPPHAAHAPHADEVAPPGLEAPEVPGEPGRECRIP